MNCVRLYLSMVVGHTDLETMVAEIVRSVEGCRGGDQDSTLIRT